MPDHIYIEREVQTHPRTREILARHPGATPVVIERYGEVFNRGQQDFRLQKRRPALVLARKHDNWVLPAPAGYGIGQRENFYFSHLLNCPYDCRYCFLQGMYRSAHHVLFVNYEDFQREIGRVAAQHPRACFFSGYDCDSLALESISGFARAFLPYFEKLPQARFELRTKSTHTAALLERPANPNVEVALSLTPHEISRRHEHKTPDLRKRLSAAAKLAKAGWILGLRLDPLIYDPKLPQQYQALLGEVVQTLPAASIRSVSVGPLRFPKAIHRKITRLYPEEALLAGPMREHSGPGRQPMVSYPRALEREMHECVVALVRHIVPQAQLFSCTPASWADDAEASGQPMQPRVPQPSP